MNQRRVAIVSSARIPFAKSFTVYADRGMSDLMTFALKCLVRKMDLNDQRLDDVSLGGVIMQASQWNFARECVLGSGLHPTTPAFDIRRACGTSLEATISVANKIALGQADVGIAGGVDSNSDAPIEFSKSFAQKLIRFNKSRSNSERLKSLLEFRPKDLLPVVPGVTEPRTGLSMGEHCEKMAQEWEISRKDQDQLAYESHHKAAAAYAEGFYDDLVYDYAGVKKDTLLRADTSPEMLAKLKPAFDRSGAGTLTAGNSTALTDGAACVLLASEEYAQKKGWPILAYVRDAQVAAVNFVADEGLLMAPTVAVGKLLQRNSLSFNDFDFFEIHEAFAAQVLCTFKAWEDENYCQERIGMPALGSVPREKLNLKGGSLALGHPFGGTGARIVGGLGKIIQQAGGGRGLISICTGGGMGVTAILEK